MDKQNLLIISEAPFYQSGYSQVVRYFGKALSEQFNIGFFCWNWYGYGPTVHEATEQFDYNPELYHIIGGNRFGIEIIERAIDSFNPQIILMVGDTFMFLSNYEKLLQKYKGKICQILYFPVDSDRFPLKWVPFLSSLDGLITFTDFGFNEIRKVSNLEPTIVNHGVDSSVFKVVSKADKESIRKSVIPIFDGKFVISWVGRNFIRKSPQSFFGALNIWEKDLGGIPDDVLVYMHTAFDNDPAGFPLSEVLTRDFPSLNNRVFYPNNFDVNNGVGQDILANIYQGSDLFVNTSMGEGWCFPITEAMACKTPVIAPAHTACEYQVGSNEERGFLIKTEGHIYATYNVVQYTIDEVSLARKMKFVYNNYDVAERKAEDAYMWARDHDWRIISNQFVDAINKYYYKFKVDLTSSYVEII